MFAQYVLASTLDLLAFVDVSCEIGLIILEALGQIWHWLSRDDILKMNP